MASRPHGTTWARWFALSAALGIAVGLAVGAFLPGSMLERTFGHGGLLLHAVGLGAISFLVVSAYRRWWLIFAGFATIAGALVELSQPLFGREAQWPDFAANIIGIAAGVALALAIHGLVSVLRT